MDEEIKKEEVQQVREIKISRNVMIGILIIIPIIIALFDITYAIVGMIVLTVIAYYMKKIHARDSMKVLVIFFIFCIGYFLYMIPSAQIARGSGTVLSDNWWNALNWIKENTAECAVVATYWDPGHFITGIAKRPVVFDGASQSSTLNYYENNTPYNEGVTTINYDKGIVQIIKKKGDFIQHARIKDIGISLFTDNESLAIELLRRYKKPNCDEMYYIASSDLIGKSVWWSYFATWDPVNKGKQYSYLTAPLSQARPIPNQNAIVFVYPFAQDQAFVVYDQNNTLQPFLQQGNQPRPVRNIFYFDRNGQSILRQNPDAVVEGTVWLTGDRQFMVFMPPEFQNAMFTRLFFYNGAGLKHFEYVNTWGGEVKLFKIKFGNEKNISDGGFSLLEQ